MYLKNYQIKVVNTLKQFYQTARETKTSFDAARKVLPENMRPTLNWVEATFKTAAKPYKDKCTTGLGGYYPRIVLKVPTGGGKTLLAVEAIREYQNLFAQKRTGLVVWIVPTETIYTQTVQKLRDKSNYLRQLLDQCSGGKTVILEKGQRLTTQDIDENLVILFVMIQSISRTNGKEALKVFQDSGGYESFFPADNRNDLHAELLKQFPNLDFIAPLNSILPLIKTSLGNAMRVSRPFIIIDEIHKVFSEMARNTIDNLNPEMVLGLSATPKAEMNVLVTITGLELKAEDMVKLDMHILPPSSRHENDWKSMIKEIKAHRDKLEKKAIEFHRTSGIFIRPMALLQVEATGKDQRGKGTVHSDDVKEYLASLNINPDDIAIKTSSQNDIEDVNLFSTDCPVRFIITKYALREGWDCSFAYILGIIPNVNSDTSITQLVGRILRQPNARKTGIKELDESYVYYCKGGTQEMLGLVEVGFRNEGLEDLVNKVKMEGNERVNPSKTAKIRKDFLRNDLQGALYLPVWLMADNGDTKRRFSFELDIKSKVNFSAFNPSGEQIKKIADSLSVENRERTGFIITLDETSHAKSIKEEAGYSEDSAISTDYLTRRYSEVIENAFLARQCAIRHIELLQTKIGSDNLKHHFSFIASQLFSLLREENKDQEEKIFYDLIEKNKLVLAVSDNPELGYKIPDTDSITVTREPCTWKFYLFDEVDLASMNSLERKVGGILDKQSKILWWFRNKVSKQWYSIQGWQQYKIHPDFVATKKLDNGKLELVYIIESKGEQLIGNPDTIYKQKVLDKMTYLSNMEKIVKVQQMSLFEVNEKAQFYCVEDGKEEAKLKELFI
ncbi:MAG: DEAD/DEAH box helicase family protein [Chitinispirillaceae bacterium]|jgi:type III restriction enzyme